jgi:hypothetical protein
VARKGLKIPSGDHYSGQPVQRTVAPLSRMVPEMKPVQLKSKAQFPWQVSEISTLKKRSFFSRDFIW